MTAYSVPANLAFDNYTDLVAAIADWMNRGDLSGSVQSMVALAEARMRRELKPYMGETSASIVCTDGLGAFPSDYGTAQRVTYGTRALDAVSGVGGMNVWPSLSEPYAWSVDSGSLRLWPSGDFTVTLFYDPMIPMLSEGNQTNAILTNHPDLYFFGAMMFAEGYVANDSRAGLFKGLFDEGLAELKTYLTRQKYGAPLVPRVGFVP